MVLGGGIVLRRRLIGFDLFRIGAALVIFLFHSQIHIQCDYGFLNEFVSMGAVFMTGFFMLSGFSLYYGYETADFSHLKNIVNFYKKRAIGILPNYYVIALLYIIFISKDYWLNFLLAPVELLGIQTFFTSLFPFSHNSGTWFISCMIVCYGIFPFLDICLKQMRPRARIVMIALLSFVLLYAPFIVILFQVARIYSNPFFRLLEFSIGALLCSLIRELGATKVFRQRLFVRWSPLVACLVLVVGVTQAVVANFYPGNYMIYSWITLPLFSFLLVSLALGDFALLERSKTIQYLSGISYSFFLVQFFAWPIVKAIESNFGVITNSNKIIFSLGLCLVMATALYHGVEKPSKSLLHERHATGPLTAKRQSD